MNKLVTVFSSNVGWANKDINLEVGVYDYEGEVTLEITDGEGGSVEIYQEDIDAFYDKLQEARDKMSVYA